VLVGALALPEGGWRRADVVSWWRTGPVRDLATGQRVPVSWWDRLAREAGVVCGLDQWRQRLDQAAEHRRRALEARPPPPPDDGAPALPDLDDRRLAGYAALAAAVEALGRRLDAPPTASWADWSDWATTLLGDVLDDPAAWPAEERGARDGVVAAVAGLARLDGVDRPPDARRARQALERELDRPAGAHGSFGHGVAVGPLVDGAGADVDLLVVVGAAEGTFPPRGSDDPLVPDRVRRAAGGHLPPRARSRAEEARDLLAAVAGARRSVLVAPRSDPRDQRERQPAPAFLEAAARHVGALVATADLDALRRQAPWFTDVESFEWWPAGGRPERVRADLDVAALLLDHRAERDVTTSAAAARRPALARGLSAALARRHGDFDAWSGNVGSRSDLLEGFDRPRSPTGLENYAVCPFRFFLGQVLGVQPLDDPTELDEISARDAGSLVHAVLERFIAERGIGKPPDEPWSDDDRARLLELATVEADELVAEGRTGRPLLWGVRWEKLQRQLLAVLDEDERLRRSWRSSPIAVEHAFGIEGAGTGGAGAGADEPVVVELAGRTVAFRGLIDRIDRTEDGGLLVLDYKTGSDAGYRDLDVDVTARGTRLQLGVYALAARRDHGAAGPVDARYWFAGDGGEPRLVGATFDDAAEARFDDVVGTMLDGVVSGRFPANPGDERWDRGRYVHDHCRYCEFERVCPTTRGWRWQQARRRPELAGYVALAEGDVEVVE
jgi:RecB family exonuclease